MEFIIANPLNRLNYHPVKQRSYFFFMFSISQPQPPPPCRQTYFFWHVFFVPIARWLTQDDKKSTATLDAVRWCARKAELNLALLDKLDVLPRAAEMAKIFGCDVFSTFSRGSQYRVECVLLRAAHAHNYLLLSPTRMHVRTQRAMLCIPLVMEPASNFYWDPVLVLDFQSLYPSIVIAYNICYATCLGFTGAAQQFPPRLGVVTPYTPYGLLLH